MLYFVICDKTGDISGYEQISFYVRCVDSSLRLYESFLGFYETPNKCGTDIAALILDVLLRLKLNLRGQTYDEAGNISGNHKGSQSVVIGNNHLQTTFTAVLTVLI